MSEQTAYLAGGCFWCLEAPFQTLKGVKEVVSGYMGGHLADPDYKAVCTGATGHAEVIAVHYDAAVISYRDLLEVFLPCMTPPPSTARGMMQARNIVLPSFMPTPKNRPPRRKP